MSSFSSKSKSLSIQKIFYSRLNHLKPPARRHFIVRNEMSPISPMIRGRRGAKRELASQRAWPCPALKGSTFDKDAQVFMGERQGLPFQ